MACTARGIAVPGGPLGIAAWHHFTACRLVNPDLPRAEIIKAGVALGHNRGQLEREWSQWSRTYGTVHAPYVDLGRQTA